MLDVGGVITSYSIHYTKLYEFTNELGKAMYTAIFFLLIDNKMLPTFSTIGIQNCRSCKG